MYGGYGKLRKIKTLIILLHLTLVDKVRSEDLSFYELDYPVKVYNEVSYNKVSFDLKIHNLNNGISSLLDSTSDYIEILKVNYKKDNLISSILFELFSNIQSTFLKLRYKYFEISHYSSNEPNIEREICHLEINYIATKNKLGIYSANLLALKNNIPNVTLSKTVADGNFIIARNAYVQILQNTNDLDNEVSKYASIFHDLKLGKINDYLFEILKSGKCVDSDQYPDLMKINECSFNKKTVTCSVTLTTPKKPENFVKIIPIPYNNNVMKLENVYKKLSDNRLTIINCANNNPVHYNCKQSEFDETCVKALNSNSLESILNACPFEHKDFIYPKITKNGILIPYIDNMKIFMKNDSDEFETFRLKNDKKSPILFQNSKQMKIVHDLFSFTYNPTTLLQNIIFSKYTPDEIVSIYKFLDNFLNLSHEEILIISQTGMGILTLIIAIIAISFCVKTEQKQKIISAIYKSLPKKSEPREMRKFLDS